ncbi:DUF2142 domain-containing protein [Pseudarthrobacter sp. NamE2]|uniref:DUF2142 domain-containing protein n=1 Tax=Pseudarthrobacter sp. NamE2 TaxID=2576838 RepID=UPI0010FD4F02|nr:DUF2142 domain-containing protein [Pseudarthrobacter sp. NamE2]TLM85661.1 DUF2142 domain-containing protein [Pseudarthrobacter sp. NamE2]
MPKSPFMRPSGFVLAAQQIFDRPSPGKVLLIAWVLIGLLGSVWCFASPLMSVPDEPAHAVKAAAVARGQLNGVSTGVQGERLTVTVPGYFANLESSICFAHRPDITADCAPSMDTTDRGPTPAQTSAGNYNPVYYGIVGIGSRGLSGEAALYAMRLLSTWLSAFFLATVFAGAVTLRRFVIPTLAAAVAITPAVLFLSAGINPNALEISAAASVFMSLCSILERSKELENARAEMWYLAAAGSLLANTRPVSLLWLAVVVTAAVLAYRPTAFVRLLRYRRAWPPMGVLVISSVFALAWVVTANSFDSLLAGAPIPSDVAAVTMADRTFVYVPEYVGVLGWLDTPPPPAVVYTWVLAMGAVLMAGLTSRPVRGRWSVAFLAVVVLGAPIALQASSSEQVGWIWQGRYILAVLAALLLACGVAARFAPLRMTPWTISIIRWSLTALALAHTYIFLEGLRRYTVGAGQGRVNWTEMFDPTWQPPFTWQGLALAYVALLTLAAFGVYRLVTLPQQEARQRAARGNIPRVAAD